MSADEVSGVYWISYTEILVSKNTPIWLKESIEKAENFRLKKEKVEESYEAKNSI